MRNIQPEDKLCGTNMCNIAFIIAGKPRKLGVPRKILALIRPAPDGLKF